MSPNSENYYQQGEYHRDADHAQQMEEALQKARDERLEKLKAELGEKLYQEWAKASQDRGWNNIRGQVNFMAELNKDERASNALRLASYWTRQHPDKIDKTVSAGGAWLANQMGRKDMITCADAYVTAAEMSLFFSDFEKGAHAFITPDMHKKFDKHRKKWAYIKGWGRDKNFVAPWPVAEKMIAKASGANGGGLWELEDNLGIPEGDWVKACKPYGYSIYSYRISSEDFKELGLKMPSGFVSGDYGSQW